MATTSLPSKDAGIGFGAGEGNRTLVLSLGSFRSTIELHPRSIDFTTFPPASEPRKGHRWDGSKMQHLAVQESDVDSSIGIPGLEVQLVGRMEQGRVEQDAAVLPVRNAVRPRSLLL